MSKTPFFKIFSNSKFSVSNNVGWGFHPNKNNEFQKSNGCHPELAAPFFADEKEAYKGGGSQSISGSSHRQKCSVICTQKSNVGMKAQPAYEYSDEPYRAEHNMDVPQHNQKKKKKKTVASQKVQRLQERT